MGVGSGVGSDVGDNMTFITVTVADMYGVQIFTADEVSTVTVRDDAEDTVVKFARSKPLMHVVFVPHWLPVEQSTDVSTPFTSTSAYSLDVSKSPKRFVMDSVAAEKS